MKKIACLLPLFVLLWAVLGIASAQQADPAVLKAKLDQKVAQMKASGATDEEIKAFIDDFKKKVAAMAAADSNGKDGTAMYKEKLDKKIADMKAAGASDDEIKKMVTEFKKKVEAEKAKAEKEKAEQLNVVKTKVVKK